MPERVSERHTAVQENETTRSEAADTYTRWVTKVIPQVIAPELEQLEKNLDAYRDDASEVAQLAYEKARERFTELVDLVEDVTQNTEVPQELRDKFEANLSAVRTRIERLRLRLDPRAYDEKVRAIGQDLRQIKELFKFKGDDPRVQQEMLEETERLGKVLKDLDEAAGRPDTDTRRDIEALYQELYQSWPSLIPESKPSKRSGPGMNADAAAWVPRTPRPPYAARLAVAPEPEPSTPMGESSKEQHAVATLEEVLERFTREHERILTEHQEIVDGLNAQIRERKLAALRATLKTPS